MISRTAGVIATLLIGLGVPGYEVRAQYYPYPYPPPPGPPYRSPSAADADDNGPPQVPYYRSPGRAWVPRAGTEANAGGAPVQSDPRYGDPRTGDPRYSNPHFSALPPEDRPETGPRKELPPQFRRTQVDYFTKEPAGTIVIDTPNTYLYLVLGNGKALRYGIGVGREGFIWSGAEKISRMAEWPDWNPPEQMIERQPYLPRFMAGGDGNPLGARALYLGDTLYRIHGTNQPSTIGSFVSSGCIRLTNEDITDLYGRVKVGTRVVVLSGKERANASAPVTSPRRGSTAARSSAPSAAEVAAKKRKPPKEPEQQTTTGSARGEASAARDNAPRTDVKAEHAGFEE
jgi:lipoprotein-anchoring transpeptidase ErfK/SrfK